MQAFSLNSGSAIPVKSQLKAHVKYQIMTGLLHPGDQLPPLRDLAAGLSVHLNTVVRAMDELEADGYLHSYQGKGVFVAEDPPGPGQGAALRSMLAGVLQSAQQWGISPEEMALSLLAHGGLARPPRAAPHRLLLVGGSRPQLRRLQAQIEGVLPAVAVPTLADELDPRMRSGAGGPVACTLFHAAAVRRHLPGTPLTVVADPAAAEAFAALQRLPAGTTVAVAARDWVHAARIRQSVAAALPDSVSLAVVAGQDPAALAPVLRSARVVLAAADCGDLARAALGGAADAPELIVEPGIAPTPVLDALRRLLGAPATEPRVQVRSAWF
jgi:DNA-binding transcriptional regulator YhcF (GntR family)